METAARAIIATILLAGGLLWLQAIGRMFRGEPLLPCEPRRPAPWGLFDLCLAWFLLAGFQTAAAFVLQGRGVVPPKLPWENLPADQRLEILLSSSVATLLAIAASLPLIHFRTRAGLSDFGLSRGRWLADLRLGVAAFAMIAPPVYLIQWVLTQWFPSEHDLVKLLKANSDLKFVASAAFSAVLAAPLVEEVLFRVLLQGWLESAASQGRSFNDWLMGTGTKTRPIASSAVPPDSSTGDPVATKVPAWPLFIGAGVFAALHLGHGPDPIPLFAFAIGLGFLYQRTHRILPGLIVHLLLNASSLAALVAETQKR